MTIDTDSEDPEKETVTVIVPTFQRSEALLTALTSITSQSVSNIHILVVDNNPRPQEKQLINRFAKEQGRKIDYIHCPAAGVSNARNAALAHVKSRYIAFLDDDMEACPHWIENSLSTAQKFNAGIVFTPTLAIMPDPDDPRNPYIRPFFSHILEMAQECITEKSLGTGGTLLDLSKCELPSPPFDTRLNETGGEDDKFFEHLRRIGAVAAWSPQAETYEIVPKSRATSTYIWERNFGYGQGPSRTQIGRGLRGLPGLLRFMTTGTMQFAVYGPIFALLKVMQHPAYVYYMAKTARAMGKIYWGKTFSPRLYGQAVSLQLSSLHAATRKKIATPQG